MLPFVELSVFLVKSFPFRDRNAGRCIVRLVGYFNMTDLRPDIYESHTDIRRLTTGIRSEKCVVRRFRRCANVIECT